MVGLSYFDIVSDDELDDEKVAVDNFTMTQEFLRTIYREKVIDFYTSSVELIHLLPINCT